jgi:hydroxyacylglutathione hydrolase
MLNKNGYESYDEVISRGNVALSVDEFKTLAAQDEYMVLDVRHETDYGVGHIPGSRFIGLDGNFAMWVGTLIQDINQKIILVAPEGREIEALTRLSRVGYDNTVGYLKGGFKAWFEYGEPIETERQISAEMFAKFHKEKEIVTLDVRKPSEYDAEHIQDARLFSVDYIFDHLDQLDKNVTYYLHCAGGYRSMSAISILRQYGYTNLVNISGGFDAIRFTDVPVTEYVCPSTV